MRLEEFTVVDGKKMRCGYTTGTCALATTTAALESLKKKEKIDFIKVSTPSGIDLNLEVHEIYRDENEAKYSIIKDAGDDPDITNGLEITATVSILENGKIILDGGKGIGRIKKKGLFGNIGEAAINPVPKKLLLEVLEKYSVSGLKCVIEAPKGSEIAKKTFNPYMGIEGGISIIGTKGIVYPMSKEAYIKSMYIELDIIREQGFQNIILTPGNYGENVIKKMGLDWPVVLVSNFFGDTLRYAESIGFKEILVLGHIGKMSKLSIGIFNTHSAIADTRMEAFVYYLTLMGGGMSLIQEVNGSISAEEALKKCNESGYSGILKKMEEGCEERIKKYIRNDEVKIKAIIYSMAEEGQL